MAGANGVVLVTTKKGKSGAPVLSYNGYIGFQNPTRITDQVNSYEYALMKNEAAMNAGYPNYYAYSQHDLEMYRKPVPETPMPILTVILIATVCVTWYKTIL